MKQTIRIAFIGAGPTTLAHLKAFADIPVVTLVGIYNRTKSKAELLAHQFKIQHVCSSIKDLYKRSKPDLVIISVYETAKMSIMRQCLPYRVPILSEKPIGLNYEESIQIADLVAKSKCQAWISLNRRFFSSTQLAHELLAKSDSSQRIIEITDQQDLTMARSLGHAAEVLRYWMYANSIHLVDYFSHFARGSVEQVTCLSPWDSKNPGFVAAHIKFSSQDEGIYQAYWNRPGPWSCTISNAIYYIELNPLESLRFRITPSRQWQMPARHEWDLQFKPGFRYQAEEAFKAVCGKPHLLCDLSEALYSTKLINTIYDISSNCISPSLRARVYEGEAIQRI